MIGKRGGRGRDDGLSRDRRGEREAGKAEHERGGEQGLHGDGGVPVRRGRRPRRDGGLGRDHGMGGDFARIEAAESAERDAATGRESSTRRARAAVEEKVLTAFGGGRGRGGGFRVASEDAVQSGEKAGGGAAPLSAMSARGPRRSRGRGDQGHGGRARGSAAASARERTPRRGAGAKAAGTMVGAEFNAGTRSTGDRGAESGARPRARVGRGREAPEAPTAEMTETPDSAAPTTRAAARTGARDGDKRRRAGGLQAWRGALRHGAMIPRPSAGRLGRKVPRGPEIGLSMAARGARGAGPGSSAWGK